MTRILVLLMAGLFAFSARANETLIAESEERAHGTSVAPIFAYEPTYRYVAGLAFFHEGESVSFGIDSYTNFQQVYQAHIKFAHKIAPSWRYRFYLVGIKGFDSYTGEGGETRIEDRVKLWGSRSVNDFSLEYWLSEIVRFEWIWALRTRTEDSHEQPGWSRRFPDEVSGATGIGIQVDTTKKAEPTDGFKFRTYALYAPPQLTTLKSVREFYQLGGSLIVYKAILDELATDIVAAFRIEAGTTVGVPSYMFKYRLGGSDGISGYQDNRFRGKKYYAQLTEVRYPIWKFLGGAVSLGFGDATDDAFTNPKLSYGAGLRIGLPPDWVSKVRIDFAWGRDESGVFVNFGQAF